MIWNQHLQAKLLCLHSFSSLFQYLLHRVFSPVGTEEADKCSWWAFRSDCRAQIKSETWWKDTFFLFFSFLIHHALWHIVSAFRKGTAQRGVSDNRTRQRPGRANVSQLRLCCSDGVFPPRNEKKKKNPFASRNRQKDSQAIYAAQPVGLVPVNECIWCLVRSRQACLHERMPSRRAELYSPTPALLSTASMPFPPWWVSKSWTWRWSYNL